MECLANVDSWNSDGVPPTYLSGVTVAKYSPAASGKKFKDLPESLFWENIASS